MGKKLLLCILDGWGLGPDHKSNAIYMARTPNWDRMLDQYPYCALQASGEHVGLPPGQMGNSEVGHMTIGAGQVIDQDLPRLNAAMQEPSRIKSLNDCLQKTPKESSIHIMGLFSDGGVHSHIDHMLITTKYLASHGASIKLHLILDGRDTNPDSAVGFLERLQDLIDEYPGKIMIATLSGRFFTMDRDNRWERIEKGYDVMMHGNDEANASSFIGSKAAKSMVNGFEESDEFFTPMFNDHYDGMLDGDSLIVTNYRADRIKQILFALLDPNFDKFEHKADKIQFSSVIGFAKYDDALTPWMESLLEPIEVENTLGEIISNAGLKQLRIGETEKYAHVTYFFNCGRQEPFEGEERILVPSPKVRTYDSVPEMSAWEVTKNLTKALKAKEHDLIVVNYANGDMVGHTGNMAASVKAVEVLDEILGELEQVCTQNDYVMLVTADHGNVDCMYKGEDPNVISTAHSLNPVPLVLVNAPKHYDNQGAATLKEAKSLADIAPIVLELMGL